MIRNDPFLDVMGLATLWQLRQANVPTGVVSAVASEGASEGTSEVADGDPLPVAVSEVAALGWQALRERVSVCQACRLCETRTQTVFGAGDQQAEWMVIGEGPGATEDQLGEPFVGQAGKLLDNMLQAVGVGRASGVYIANVVKCRPPGNRDPEPDEVAACDAFLKQQIALLRPKIILALGRFAAQTLLRSDAKISALRGSVHDYDGVPVVVTYHPAYLLRSMGDKAKAWEDLCLARQTLQLAAHGSLVAGPA